MPEYTELVSSCMLARHWFNSVRGDFDFQLANIMIDATIKEQEAAIDAKEDSNVAKGLPYNIEPGCTVCRGQNSSQGPVYPPPLGQLPISAVNIELVDIEFNPRNIILQMLCNETETGHLLLQVQMLTHTVLQIYTGTQWHNSICKVSADTRGFRVGMALDFGDWVVAFLSLDNMFKPIYAIDREDLPAQHIDVYFDFEKFVDSAVNWAHCALFSQKRADEATLDNRPTGFPNPPKPLATRDRLALHAIRKSDIFGGLGVYTATEVFFLAGLAGDLMERELFDDPSRFARLIEAFYEIAAAAHEEIAAAAHEEIWDFVKPFLHDTFFIAVENKHRTLYAKRLYIYAKDRVQMPKRMKTLVKMYKSEIEKRSALHDGWIRKPDGKLLDTFEPSFLQRSLTKKKNLGSLIFGKEAWQKLGGTVWDDNPMERYFANRLRHKNPMDRFVIKKPSVAPPLDFLPPITYYDPLYLPSSDMRTSWVPSYLYSTTSKKFWSVLPLMPSNSFPDLPFGVKYTVSKIENLAGDERKTELFDHIVNHTKKWAVGPLDYCGIARIAHGKIALCHDDPEASPYVVHRLARSLHRRVHSQKGSRKVAYKAKAQRDGIYYNSSSSSLGVDTSSIAATDDDNGAASSVVNSSSAPSSPVPSSPAPSSPVPSSPAPSSPVSSSAPSHISSPIPSSSSLVLSSTVVAHKKRPPPSPPSTSSSSKPQPLKIKKPRLSADQKIALGLPLTIWRTKKGKKREGAA